MVRLDRIYTRGGDDGSTSLGDGSRVPKTHPRVEAFGTLDELNAALGACLDPAGTAGQHERLRGLQRDLFDLGAELCFPPGARRGTSARRVTGDRIAELEAWIDEVGADLKPLNGFVLPGGPGHSAALHLARAVCRRAERRVGQLASEETVRAEVGIYLNRLSDLLFVLARQSAGGNEPLWMPGKSKS